MPESSRAPRFYGWVVVGAVFGVLFVAFGAAYSFAAFFNALRDDFGATRGDISLVFALAGFLYFGLGSVTGLLADRLGPRRAAHTGRAGGVPAARSTRGARPGAGRSPRRG